MVEYRVCLSFDFDAMSGLLARGLNTQTPVSRGELGSRLGGRELGNSWSSVLVKQFLMFGFAPSG